MYALDWETKLIVKVTVTKIERWQSDDEFSVRCEKFESAKIKKFLMLIINHYKKGEEKMLGKVKYMDSDINIIFLTREKTLFALNYMLRWLTNGIETVISSFLTISMFYIQLMFSEQAVGVWLFVNLISIIICLKWNNLNTIINKCYIRI